MNVPVHKKRDPLNETGEVSSLQLLLCKYRSGDGGQLNDALETMVGQFFVSNASIVQLQVGENESLLPIQYYNSYTRKTDFNVPTMSWRGVAWRGVAWRGVAWRGVAARACACVLSPQLEHGTRRF